MRMTAKIKDFREILLPHSDCGHEREYAEMMAEKLFVPKTNEMRGGIYYF